MVRVQGIGKPLAVHHIENLEHANDTTDSRRHFPRPQTNPVPRTGDTRK